MIFMWSKGAVVVVKRGDETMANSMEKALMPKRDNKTCKTELAAIARQKDIAEKIVDARIKYGYNWVPTGWAKKAIEGFALIIYGISVFIDRYLTIKE